MEVERAVGDGDLIGAGGDGAHGGASCPVPRRRCSTGTPLGWSAVRTADFDYPLPPARIAQTPVEPRDAARLLVDRGPGRAPEHRHVRDLPDLLRPGDLVVVNDTRVLPARLHLQRAVGRARRDPAAGAARAALRTWEALARPARRLKHGRAAAAPGAPRSSRWATRVGDGSTLTVSLLGDGDALAQLGRYGEVPLPPYITEPLADPGATRRCTPIGPARWRRPPPGSTSRRRCSTRLAASGHRAGAGRAGRGPRHVQAGRRRRPGRPPDAQRALPGAPTTCWPRAAPPRRRRAGRGRRHHHACGRSRAAAAGEPGGRTELFIRRPVPVAAGRRAAHELPPAPHDAADAGRRVRRAPLARALRRRAGRAAIASCPSATPCCSTRSQG